MSDLEKAKPPIGIRVYVKLASGRETERDLTLLAVPRVGEILLVPGAGLTPGFRAVVTEVVHQPASRDFDPEIYLKAQSEDC